MSNHKKQDKTLCYDSGIGEFGERKFFFSLSDFGCIKEEPVIELEHHRIRIGCWYVTLDAFTELSKRWLDFRGGKSKLRIQG